MVRAYSELSRTLKRLSQISTAQENSDHKMTLKVAVRSRSLQMQTKNYNPWEGEHFFPYSFIKVIQTTRCLEQAIKRLPAPSNCMTLDPYLYRQFARKVAFKPRDKSVNFEPKKSTIFVKVYCEVRGSSTDISNILKHTGNS